MVQLCGSVVWLSFANMHVHMSVKHAPISTNVHIFLCLRAREARQLTQYAACTSTCSDHRIVRFHSVSELSIAASYSRCTNTCTDHSNIQHTFLQEAHATYEYKVINIYIVSRRQLTRKCNFDYNCDKTVAAAAERVLRLHKVICESELWPS